MNPITRTTALLETELAALRDVTSRKLEDARHVPAPETETDVETSGSDPKTSDASRALKKSARLPEVHLRELSMRVSPETNRVVIAVIDSKTKAVVRQIPAEDALDLLRNLPKSRALFVDREG